MADRKPEDQIVSQEDSAEAGAADEVHEGPRPVYALDGSLTPPVEIDPTRTPAVIMDDVHIDYRVFRGGRAIKGKVRSQDEAKSRIRIVNAVQGISAIAYKGDSIGVVGFNGSGKSTLMRGIAGLNPLASGTIYASAQPRLLGVGSALLPNLSGEKNVLLGSLAMGVSASEARSKAEDIVEFSGIREFIEMPMRTYSSGMSARLKFAIAAGKDHEILIIDEALAVGDKDFAARSEARIREMRDSAGTVFLVSHSMASIRDTCNKVMWINKGKLVLFGETEEVIREYEDTPRPSSTKAK